MKTPTPTELNVAINEWRCPGGVAVNKRNNLPLTHGLPDHITGTSARHNLNEVLKKLTQDQFFLFFEYLQDEVEEVVLQKLFLAENKSIANALVRVVKPEMFR